MAEVKPCPICDKIPKTRCKDIGPGYIVTIMCKPLFEKPHLYVTAYDTYCHNAMNEAMKNWNKKVEETFNTRDVS